MHTNYDNKKRKKICKTTSHTTIKISFILYITLIFSNFNLIAQEVANLSFRDTTLTVEERVEHLLNILTLEEKLSMLDHTNPAIEHLGIDEYNWWNEALHGLARKGKATSFPQAIGLAATLLKTLLSIENLLKIKWIYIFKSY